MIQKVKKIEPDNKKVKELRESISLSQEGLLKSMKSLMGSTMSRRTYQRIENGDLSQPLYLEELTKFYNKYYETNSIKGKGFLPKKITVSDLVLGKNQKDKKYKKIINEYETMTDYLYPIKHFEDVKRLISNSDRRKFFYHLTPGNEVTSDSDGDPISEKIAIQNIVRQIDENSRFKSDKNLKNITNETYGQFNEELKEISAITFFGENLDFLNSSSYYSKREINLYAGNIYLPQLGWKKVSSEIEGDIYDYEIIYQTITIFCFREDSEPSLNFNYQNYWHFLKLDNFLKEKKINLKTDGIGDQYVDEVKSFENEIKYFRGIDTSKVTFDHKVPFTNDEFDDPFDYEPDGKDLAEIDYGEDDEPVF